MIRKMFCHKCQKEQEIVLSESGPHIKASCLEGHYLKFMSQEELTGKPKGGTMSDFEIQIDLPGSQYNECILVELYKDQYSLMLAVKGKADSTVYKKWTYPQVRKDGKNYPAEKAIPLKLPLGNRDDAVKVIRALAAAFGIGAPVGQGTAPQVSDDDDDGIPF